MRTKENNLQQEQCGRCGPTGAGAYAARRRRRRKHSANVHFARLQGINP